MIGSGGIAIDANSDNVNSALVESQIGTVCHVLCRTMLLLCLTTLVVLTLHAVLQTESSKVQSNTSQRTFEDYSNDICITKPKRRVLEPEAEVSNERGVVSGTKTYKSGTHY